MSVSKIATSAVMALSLIAVPTLASAAPAAAKLSIATAPAVKGKKAAGGSLVIALLAAAAVIGGIVIAAGGKGTPVSR